MDIINIDMEILTLGISLVGLILVNILLGSVSSILEKRFNKEKFFQGLIKGAIVTISFVAVYFIGTLNPEIIVISMNGADVSLLTAINLTILSGYIWYAKEVVTKLASFIGKKTSDIEQIQAKG